MKNEDELEDFFRDVFRDAQLEPSAKIWEKISQSQEQASLEEQFAKAFDDAQLTPSDKVWEGISEKISPKKPRIAWLAGGIAASIAIALGSFWLNDSLQESNKAQLAQKVVVSKAQNISPNTEKLSTDKPKIDTNNSPTEKLSQPTTQKVVDKTKLAVIQENKILPTSAPTEKPNQIAFVEVQEEKSLAFLDTKQACLPIFWENDSLPKSLEKLAVLAQNQEQNLVTPVWYVGLQVAYQSFSPNFELSQRALQTPSIFLSKDFLQKSNIGEALQNNIRFTEASEVGIDFGRKLGKHWAIQTGFYRNVVSYEINTSIVQSMAADAQNGEDIIWKDILGVRQVFVGVPLGVRYGTQKEAWNWYVLGGVQSDFLISEQSQSQLAFVQYELGELRRQTWSAWAGLSVAYQISTHWQIGTEWSYRQQLQSLYQGTELNSQASRSTLRLNLRYGF